MLKSLSIGYVIAISVVVLIKIALGFIVSEMAIKKGYNGVAFYLFGFVYFIPALVLVSILSDYNKKEEELNAELLLLYKRLYKEEIITEKEYLDKKEEFLDDLRDD